MPPTRQITNSAQTLVLDLNASTSSGIATIHFALGDPVVEEDWFFSKDAHGGTLSKALDRPARGKFVLRIVPQASPSAVRTKVEAVRDAFFTSGNLLKIQETGDGAARYFPLYQTRLADPLADEAVARQVQITSELIRWEFEYWREPYPQGASRYALM